MKRHIAIALAAAAACMHASAQENNPGSASPWQMPHQPEFWRYASVSVGRSAYDLECPQGVNQPCNQKDTAFRVAAGGRFNRAFGMEIGYVDLGDVPLTAWQGHARARGLDLSLVGSATVFDRVGVNARIGTIYGWTRSRLRVAINSCILHPAPDSFCNRSESAHGLRVRYGAGLSARIARRVDLRLDWDRYRLPFTNDQYFYGKGAKPDVDFWSAGFNFLF